MKTKQQILREYIKKIINEESSYTVDRKYVEKELLHAMKLLDMLYDALSQNSGFDISILDGIIRRLNTVRTNAKKF